MNICDTKVAFDTEFEATVSAAKRGHQWGVELIVYKCGSHYHIANKDKNLRRQHIRPSYCDICNCAVKPTRYKNHIKKDRHIRLQRQRDAI